MDDKEVIEQQTAGDEAENESTRVDETASAENESLTPEQVNDLKKKADKANHYYEQLLRVTADLDNFRKRAAREKQEAIKFANEGLLEKLLPVLDNFEAAIAAAGAANTTVESLRSGVQMIAQQLKTAMTEAGLQEIDAAGQAFDPNFHEALSQMESADVPEGNVLQQIRKGYRLRDRLLRPASVIVAKKPGS